MLPANQVIFAALIFMGALALVNAVSFPSLVRHRRPRVRPLVSVLLPARNEAKIIGGCLSQLSAQDYSRTEVIVLDDNSDDGTAEVVASWERRDARIQLVRGTPLPSGWVGKCHACHQLSGHARGDLLLFVDADTILGPETVSAAVAAMEERGADLLTVIPHQVMRSFWEKMILPLLHFSTFCFLPMPLVRLSRNSRLAMANGQFMLFRREVYEQIGGHAAVRAAIVEDVWLSRRVKRFGRRLQIMDGADVLSCRMYTSFRGIWEGFSKNLFAGFRYSIPAIAAVIIFNTLTSVLPYVLLVGGLIKGAQHQAWFIVVGGQVAVLSGIRWLLALRFRMSLWPVFLHPFAMVVMVAIALNSCRLAFTGGARWKGRRYDFRDTRSAHKRRIGL